MKEIDANGFWSIKNNPISKVGVFPYLGKQIDSSLEPDKVYMVLRPADELFSSEALASFNENPVPLVDDHTMLGDEFTPAEQKGIDGVVQNIRQDGDKLIGDLSIYSTELKKKIANGKKDLSMGYFCEYDLTGGEYNGEHYDAIQRNIRSNHIALVDRGRCGHDVRVFDKWCFDCAISEDKLGTIDAEFKESDHPRDNDGKFTSGGGGNSSGKTEPTTENKTNVGNSSGNKHIHEASKEIKEYTDFVDQVHNYLNSSKKFRDSLEAIKQKYGEEAAKANEEYSLHQTVANNIGKAIKNKELKEKIKEAIEFHKNSAEKAAAKFKEIQSKGEKQFSPTYKIDETKLNNTLNDKNKERLEYMAKRLEAHGNKGKQRFNDVQKTIETAIEKLKSQEDVNKFVNALYSVEMTNYVNGYTGLIDNKWDITAKIRQYKKLASEFSSDEQNTASDSGCRASGCDADYQLKIKEIKHMIDKEKIAALKELVAMLEGEENTQPEADAKPCDEIPEIVEQENKELVKDDVTDKRELIREIGAIAGKGGLSEEDVRTLMEKAEQLAYNPSEESQEVHDEEENEIEAPKIEEEKEEKKEAEDALPQKIFEMISDRDELAKKVAPIIGNFDHSKMTAEQVAQYACDKLDIKSDTPRAAIDGYLLGYKRSKMYSIDAGIRTETAQSQIDKYLRGE